MKSSPRPSCFAFLLYPYKKRRAYFPRVRSIIYSCTTLEFHLPRLFGEKLQLDMVVHVTFGPLADQLRGKFFIPRKPPRRVLFQGQRNLIYVTHDEKNLRIQLRETRVIVVCWKKKITMHCIVYRYANTAIFPADGESPKGRDGGKGGVGGGGWKRKRFRSRDERYIHPPIKLQIARMFNRFISRVASAKWSKEGGTAAAFSWNRFWHSVAKHRYINIRWGIARESG